MGRAKVKRLPQDSMGGFDPDSACFWGVWKVRGPSPENERVQRGLLGCLRRTT